MPTASTFVTGKADMVRTGTVVVAAAKGVVKA